MRQFLRVPYEYGKQLPIQMKRGDFSKLVKPDSPTLKVASDAVALPLTDQSKKTLEDMMWTLQHDSCPMVLDSLSAPMVGEPQSIVMLSMKLRNSHLRNLPKESSFSFKNKLVVMINP